MGLEEELLHEILIKVCQFFFVVKTFQAKELKKPQQIPSVMNKSAIEISI